MSTIRALSPSDSCSAGRDRRRRSFGATVRISSVCSNRSSRSRSRPRMVIVQRDKSPVPLKLEDYLDGTTSDTSSPDSSAHEKDSPDSSVHEKDLGPTSVTLPQPFAPPSIAGPSEGRQMDKVWGADLPAVPAMKQASEVDEVDRGVPTY